VRLQTHATGQPPGASHAELLADLAEARRAERVAASLLAEVRDELAATVINAKAKGVGYDHMAQATLRAVHSPVTLPERRREAVRLRKLVHRHRVTKSHGYQTAPPGTSPGSDSPSIQQGGGSMGNPRLISRKTVEETFVDSDEDERLDDADDIEGEDDTGEGDNKPPRAARPRR
jgi:hypothetical protein